MSLFRYAIQVRLTKEQREWIGKYPNYNEYIRKLIQKDMKRG